MPLAKASSDRNESFGRSLRERICDVGRIPYARVSCQALRKIRFAKECVEELPHMRRSMRRKCGREGNARIQFGSQAAQRRNVVDIIPRRQHVYGKTDLGCAIERLTRNGLGAPRHVLEYPPVG